ncbi:LPXTG cell wall anchor domain-containing protein [Streptococcus uberis]|uniref:LPXTG cell wall anchor domain-containing protein n=1 Tax=Streptococcus uberis TaxID=1349 RepID=UPI0012B5A77E|nr:LPXTG cell wall anchor domain-containing protein [Streptococcus uberis]MTC87237.1 LPXTG cell wall anchor domain-containing protein [Streptococcus uberis]
MKKTIFLAGLATVGLLQGTQVKALDATNVTTTPDPQPSAPTNPGVSEQDVAAAQTAYNTATTNAATAQAAYTTQANAVSTTTTAVNTAKAELTSQQSQVSALEQTASTVSTNVAQTSEQLAAAETAAATAQADATQAQDTYNASVSEVTAKTAELQAAANQTTTQTETTTVVTTTPATTNDANQPYGKTAPVSYSGDKTEVITLNSSQVTDLTTKGEFTYTPDYKAVSHFAVDYINEIRALNGIEGRVYYDDTTVEIAIKRAEEMLATKTLSHFTNLASQYPQYAGDNAAMVSDTFTYTGLQTLSGVYSDKEYAYKLVLEWFSDHKNVFADDTNNGALNYGHRNALLEHNGGLAVASAHQPLDPTVPLTQTNRQQLGFSDMPFTVNHQITQWVEIMPGVMEEQTIGDGRVSLDFTYVANADGELVQYLNGKEVVFLPRTVFEYVYTNTRQVVDAAAVQALNDYKKSAAARLLAEKTAMETAQSISAAKQVSVLALQEKLKQLQSEQATINADLSAAKAQVAATTEEFNSLLNKLESEAAQLKALEAANKAAQALRSQLFQTYKDVLAARQATILAEKYASILAENKIPVAVVDSTGKIIDYTAQDKPVDTPVDAPVDTPVDAPVETPVDTPVDTPVNAPVGFYNNKNTESGSKQKIQFVSSKIIDNKFLQNYAGKIELPSTGEDNSVSYVILALSGFSGTLLFIKKRKVQ